MKLSLFILRFGTEFLYIFLPSTLFWTSFSDGRRIETGNTEICQLGAFICRGMGIMQLLYMTDSFNGEKISEITPPQKSIVH